MLTTCASQFRTPSSDAMTSAYGSAGGFLAMSDPHSVVLAISRAPRHTYTTYSSAGVVSSRGLYEWRCSQRHG